MNGEQKIENVKEEALRLCKEFLGGPWKNVSLQDFRMFEVRGGLSNTLYRCALPEDILNGKSTKAPKEILLRLYGPLQEDPNVVLSEVVIFVQLSERKLGPKLYGVFSKGRLEEFIPSHTLDSAQMRQYSSHIAREMAKIHALDVPVRKVPDFFQTFMNKWLLECKETIFKDRDGYFLPFTEYKKEIAWCSQLMEQTDTPVVFCHNDLQQGNVLYREDSTKNGNPDIMLIDFEFGAYYYRGFDIANHLCEWCFDYGTPDYPHFQVDVNKFPSRDEQVAFCTEYLDQLRIQGVQPKRSIQEETESIVKDMSLFAAACNLIWSLWSIKMTLVANGFGHRIADKPMTPEIHRDATTEDHRHWKERLDSTIKSSLKEHSRTRKELFHRFKELYLQSTPHN